MSVTRRMLRCILFGHAVAWGPCPNCHRRARGLVTRMSPSTPSTRTIAATSKDSATAGQPLESERETAR